jgi:tetratricopeptide (TPR) repeat protein
VSNLAIAAVSALLATNQPAAVSNLVQSQTGLSIPISVTNDPVELELEKLMKADDDARREVMKWVEDNDKFAEQGAGLPRSEMRRRISERFKIVRKGYEDLIQQHTNRADIRVAYASYLGETGDEESAIAQLETARTIDTNNPAIWNNLANLYGHNGEVRQAFDCYTRAIAIDPTEPVYYHNFGTTVFLFRKDAREHYSINEQQVFDKALALYSNAIRLDPKDFQLAADVAQTFYGIKPPRTEDALRAWTNAFQLAGDEAERQGVHVHFARIKLKAGFFDEARAHLNVVTNADMQDLKTRVKRTLEAEIEKRTATNAPAGETKE